jgi:hypothetical protein
VPALVFVTAAPASGVDELRVTQRKLVGARDSKKLPRDEVPLEDVAIAKRQLLSWAESRLQTFGANADPEVLTKSLSKELDDAIKLFPMSMTRTAWATLISIFRAPNGNRLGSA